MNESFLTSRVPIDDGGPGAEVKTNKNKRSKPCAAALTRLGPNLFNL